MADAKVFTGTVQGGFVVYTDAGVPVTGLVQSDFTALLSKDGVDDAVTAVTISEVGQGRYHYAFLAPTVAEWFLVIRYAVENPRGWSEDLIAVALSTYTGAGGSAPKKYWGKQKTNMRNAFMIQENLRHQLQIVEEKERRKLLGVLLLLDEED